MMRLELPEACRRDVASPRLRLVSLDVQARNRRLIVASGMFLSQ